MFVVLAPQIFEMDSLLVGFAEKGDKVPLVPEGDINAILGDIDNQDEERDKDQDQDGQAKKLTGFCQTATRQNHMSRREEKSRQAGTGATTGRTPVMEKGMPTSPLFDFEKGVLLKYNGE
jgi:hypothetical protein